VAKPSRSDVEDALYPADREVRRCGLRWRLSGRANCRKTRAAMRASGSGRKAFASRAALSQLSPNNLVTLLQGDVSEVDRPRSFVSPQRLRKRLTDRLRAEVIEAYEFGQTSRQVAERFELGRTTVLNILKEAGVTVRPQGQKY
jgi:hypothetical protein